MSDNTWSLHAGLIANDAILFLDEAHCSTAFASTLEAVEHYRGESWSREPLGRRFHFVEMTATLSRNIEPADRFCVDSADRTNDVLAKRIFASKPTHLLDPVKCRKDEFSKFAAALVAEGIALADTVDAKRVAIIVNRISTAKEVQSQLLKAKQNSILVIGRMRPVERDDVAREWEPLKSGMPREATSDRRFVVSTQCLEVGADLDFDILVSECASIDALQQRFGRLDRVGALKRLAAVCLSAPGN